MRRGFVVAGAVLLVALLAWFLFRPDGGLIGGAGGAGDGDAATQEETERIAVEAGA